MFGAAVVLVATGCGSAPEGSPESTAAGRPAATPAVPTTTSSAAAATVIPVTISAGTVTPTNAEAQARVGLPITLEVSSDAPDSIHVHSVPEHVFDVQARPGQRFEFTVGVSGQVDVETHKPNRTVVTITVRPG